MNVSQSPVHGGIAVKLRLEAYGIHSRARAMPPSSCSVEVTDARPRINIPIRNDGRRAVINGLIGRLTTSEVVRGLGGDGGFEHGCINSPDSQCGEVPIGTT